MEFFSRYSKLFAVLGFLAVVFVLGYGLYALFFKAAPTDIIPQTQEQATTTGNKLPGAGDAGSVGTAAGTKGRLGTGGEEQEQTGINAGPGTSNPSDSLNQVKEITQAESYGVTGNGNGVQYYNKSDGKFYRIDASGNLTAMSDKVFNNVDKVVWAPDKNKAVLEYPDGANIVYNFGTKRQVTLPSHWEDFDFSTDGSKLVFKSIGIDPDNRWLAVTNDDGSKAKKIEQIGENADKVIASWSPNNQSIAMYAEGADFNRQDVYFVGLNNENFKSMSIEGRGFQPKWSPSGDQLVYSVYSSDTDMKPMLWMANAKGDAIGSGRQKLDVETWAEKCTFYDPTSLYCAVPDSLEEGAGLFPQMAKNTSDKLYAIDIRTGDKKLVSTPDGSYNMSGLTMSDDGKILYFTDANSKKIYKIDLKQ